MIGKYPDKQKGLRGVSFFYPSLGSLNLFATLITHTHELNILK